MFLNTGNPLNRCTRLRHLCLNDKQLDSLPEGFENISVGVNLALYGNWLVEQSCSFPNVQGEVYYEEPDDNGSHDYI